MTKLHTPEWFKELVVEDTPEEKAKMAELRKQVEADIEDEIKKAKEYIPTPEEIAEAEADIKRIMEEFNKAMAKTDEMIAQFNKDFPDNPIEPLNRS